MSLLHGRNINTNNKQTAYDDAVFFIYAQIFVCVHDFDEYDYVLYNTFLFILHYLNI